MLIFSLKNKDGNFLLASRGQSHAMVNSSKDTSLFSKLTGHRLQNIQSVVAKRSSGQPERRRTQVPSEGQKLRPQIICKEIFK